MIKLVFGSRNHILTHQMSDCLYNEGSTIFIVNLNQILEILRLVTSLFLFCFTAYQPQGVI